MAALGKILRKGTGGNSVHTTAHYERLNQDPSDNEEEDDILFVQQGEAAKQNGFTHSPAARNNNSIPNGSHPDIELNELGIKKGKIRSATEVEVRVMKRGALTRTRITCFILTILIAILFVIALIFVVPHLSKKFGVQINSYQQTPEWNVTYEEFGTESLVRLVDVDDDGRLDIIFSIIPGDEAGREGLTRSNGEEYCKSRGYKEYPCVSKVRALRGYDGALMWEFSAHSSIFEMNCDCIDINKDGKMDCIATGRLTTVVAFNPKNGEVFWTGDDSVFEDRWNNYNVLALPDFNDDGVSELLLPHGGDLTFPPQEKSRYSGRLIILDGATGKQFGQRYLEMPDSKETYMSPVMHTHKDGSQYILFGHGGETVPGTLFAISVPDLYRYVMKVDSSSVVPKMKGEYTSWEKLTKNEIGLMEIYRSQKKGVMVPPVCVDMNKDGVNDILMSAYDGTVILYDGQTLDKMWTATFDNQESYSTPALGYFNDDDVLDFMIHQNVGAWPAYSSSQTLILDGKTGKIIWSLNSTQYDMTSDLVARTTEPNRDIFVFRVAGHIEPTGTDDKVDQVARLKRDVDDDEFLPNHRRKTGPHFSTKPRRPNPSTNRRWPNTYQAPSSRYRTPTNYGYNLQNQYMGNYNQKPTNYASKSRSRLGPNSFYDDDYDNMYDYESKMKNPDADYLETYGGLMPSTEDLADLLSDISKEEEVHDDSEEKDDQSLPAQDDVKEDEDDGIPSCKSNPDDFGTMFLAMDRSTASSPLQVYRFNSFKQYYNFTDKTRAALPVQEDSDQEIPANNGQQREKRHGGGHDALDKEQTYIWSGKACIVMALQEKTTGALGDLDGDGTLDLVAILDGIGTVTDAESEVYIRTKMMSGIVKINLQSKIKKSATGIGITPVASRHSLGKQNEKAFSELSLLPYKNQPWTGYMGKKGNSIYEINEHDV